MNYSELSVTNMPHLTSQMLELHLKFSFYIPLNTVGYIYNGISHIYNQEFWEPLDHFYEATTSAHDPSTQLKIQPQMNSINAPKLIILKLPIQFNTFQYKYYKEITRGKRVYCIQSRQIFQG